MQPSTIMKPYQPDPGTVVPKDPKVPKGPKEPKKPEPERDDACCVMPTLRRPNYYYGRLLGPREFRGEQDYFRERMRLQTRCLHGYGVVCGLEVAPPKPKPDCPDPSGGRAKEIDAAIAALNAKAAAEPALDAKQEIGAEIEKLRRESEALPKNGTPGVNQPAGIVDVHCGYAIDCNGNDLVLERARRVRIWEMLSEADRARFDASSKVVYISICYCERREEPQRPVVFDDCGVTSECQYGWTADSVKIAVFLEGDEPPRSDSRCDVCCRPCCDDDRGECEQKTGEPCCGCLIIARVTEFDKDKVVDEEQIENWIRRPLTTYVTTKIDGISWVHGAIYSHAAIENTLFPPLDPEKGLVVHFTRPVHRSTVRRGTVDVWRIEGGLGQHGKIENVDIKLTMLPEGSSMIDRIVIRNATDESLDYGDRMLIQVRTTFFLDACCRAVDGEHIGGRVPVLKEFAADSQKQLEEAERFEVCRRQPPFGGPWHSGDQHQGGDFVSWIYCENYQRKK